MPNMKERGMVMEIVSGDAAHAQNSLDEIIRYMEGHADAELTEVLTEI